MNGQSMGLEKLKYYLFAELAANSLIVRQAARQKNTAVRKYQYGSIGYFK